MASAPRRAIGIAVITFAASVKGVVAAAPSAYPTPPSKSAPLTHVPGARGATGSGQRQRCDAGRARTTDAVARAQPDWPGRIDTAMQVAEPDPTPELSAQGGRGHRSHHLVLRWPVARGWFARVQRHATDQGSLVGSEEETDEAPGHVRPPGVDAGDQLLAGVTPLGEVDRALDHA